MSKPKNDAAPASDAAADVDTATAGVDATTVAADVDAATAGVDATTVAADVDAATAGVDPTAVAVDVPTVPARVLCTSHIGTIGDIIHLPADVALAYQADGYVDLHPSAVTADEPAA